MLIEPSAHSARKDAARTIHSLPTRRANKAGYAALFILLALIALQCARLGAAGFFVHLAQFEVDRWTDASRQPSVAEMARAANYFSDSLDYASDNPWALEGAGAMDLAKMRASRIPREALAATRDARVRFRQALRQRPSSPFLWTNLALTKLYLDEIDGELMAALRHADELGPWEPTVQQTNLFVGLAVWQELDPRLRQALVRTIERGASRNPQKMFEIVKSYARFDLVCAIKKYELIAGPDCRNAAAAAKSGGAMNQGYRQ
jgi:hypothetical protein